MEEGVFLAAENLTPGILTNMKISPADFRVQVVTDLMVSFTTQHELVAGAGLLIRLPFGLSIPDGVTELEVILSDGSSTTAAVLPGNEIRIPNMVASGATLDAGETAILKVKGVKNQNSAKDAGGFVFTTLAFLDG